VRFHRDILAHVPPFSGKMYINSTKRMTLLPEKQFLNIQITKLNNLENIIKR
jgi:hypothetical protein